MMNCMLHMNIPVVLLANVLPIVMDSAMQSTVHNPGQTQQLDSAEQLQRFPQTRVR